MQKCSRPKPQPVLILIRYCIADEMSFEINFCMTIGCDKESHVFINNIKHAEIVVMRKNDRL